MASDRSGRVWIGRRAWMVALATVVICCGQAGSAPDGDDAQPGTTEITFATAGTLASRLSPDTASILDRTSSPASPPASPAATPDASGALDRGPVVTTSPPEAPAKPALLRGVTQAGKIAPSAVPAPPAPQGSTGTPGSKSAGPAITTAEQCSKPAPRTAAEYQAMFDDLNTGLWSGGDQATSLELPDGRILWVFADTLQGEENALGGYAPGTRLVHNSLLIQQGGCLTAVTGPDGTEIVPNPAPDEYYWPQQAVLDGGRLWLFSSRVKHVSSDFLGFSIQGTDLAELSVPVGGELPRFIAMHPTPASNSGPDAPQWGNAAAADSSYHYLYGPATAKDPGTGITIWDIHLARVPRGQLTGQERWQFWTGTGWSSQPRDSARLAIPGSRSANLFSAHRLDDGRFQLTLKPLNFIGDTLDVALAPTPAGPFTFTTAAEVPGVGPGYYQYGSVAHPEIALSSGNLLVSTSRNGSWAELLADADLYKPQFIEIPASGAFTPIKPQPSAAPAVAVP